MTDGPERVRQAPRGGWLAALALLLVSASLVWAGGGGAAPPDQGPGGPILVVVDDDRPFGRYHAEILRAEGLNEFTVADVASVSAATLAAHDVVVLAEIALTAAQVTMLSDWVNGGGNLIAMRPDAQLAGLLGLTDASATLSDAYLKVDGTAPPGAGIVSQPVQFHGTADRYALDGASSVATLHEASGTPTANPAVTLRSVGSSGGQAAAFTFDLARSVVYTRQGNPAWAGQERDAVAPIRSNDLFFGAAPGDPQPDWVDLNKVAIPQADEQQRLLANLVVQMNLDKKPLPRFWYLPRGERAVVVMTGDDHARGGTAARFDQYKAISPAGCSVAEWECVRSSSYIYPKSPLTAAQAAAYAAEGFDVGLHVNPGCTDWTPSSLGTFYTTQLNSWKAKYASVPPPSGERTHCIVWSDWATQPKVQLAHGMRLDTNYYYWPKTWVKNRPGFFTGSGMPMRFADLDGTVIDVYQAVTQITDESGQTHPFTIDALLDGAIGPQGYYGAFTANMHTDFAASGGSDAIVASAQARGVPVVSGRQMLEWLDGRNGSSFGSVGWTGGDTLSFTIAVGAGAGGLRAMVPTASATDRLTAITRDGNPVPYTTETVKGVEYAFFAASAGAYQATYSRYRRAVLQTAGLEGYWRLGEAAGATANDETPNDRDGAYAGPALGQGGALFGDPDPAAGFDGVDDKLSVADFGGSWGALTLEGWIYNTAPDAEEPRILFGKDREYELRLTRSDDGALRMLLVTYGGGTTTVATDDTLDYSLAANRDRWFHVAATFDAAADAVRFYRDGQPVKDVTGFTGAIGNGSGQLWLGRTPRFGGFGTFQGRLDELAVYKWALHDYTVTDHYQAGRGAGLPGIP